MEDFDYIIVGAGTAGCVLAGRLCENSQAHVCLIEAGPNDRNIALRVPGLGFLANGRDTYLQRDITEPDPGLNDRRLTWTHGRVVGGGSSVNGMLYTRGHSSEYDAWDCRGWRFRDLLPLFRRAENSERGESEWHGDSGPLGIRKGRSSLEVADVFLEAVSETGCPTIDDLNTDAAEGFGHFDHSIGQGYRSSSSSAYLRSLKRRGRLTLMPQTRVLRVVIEAGRARGVEIAQGKQTRILSAASEVVLSAGTINSPQLLMLSGIGPAGELKRHDIRTVVDAREVGRNLQNHVRVALRYTCRKDTTAYRYLKPIAAMRGLGQYAIARQGFLAETIISTGGSLRSDSACPTADLKVTLFNALMGSAGGRLGMLPDKDGFALSVNQGVPLSRGEVRLCSRDPADRPLIYANNFSEPTDLAVLKRGLQKIRAIISSKAMAQLDPVEITGFGRASSQIELDAEIRGQAANVFHDVGTCRMGSDAASVVDERLFVRGVDGLRVVDASIAPSLVNANTNALAVVVGEKAAALVLQRNDTDVFAQ